MYLYTLFESTKRKTFTEHAIHVIDCLEVLKKSTKETFDNCDNHVQGKYAIVDRSCYIRPAKLAFMIHIFSLRISSN